MNSDPSWRLKVARAKKHLNEIEEELRSYSGRHPYEAVHDRQSQKNPSIRRFRLRLTEHPDPMLAVIIGDFLYDLRSALDHLAVSLAPRKWIRDISFPVTTVDPWKQPVTDAEREDLLKRRGRFESSIKGMPGDAVAFIKSVQPYNLPPDKIEFHFLHILSRLENADKHRELIVLSHGVRDVTLVPSMNERVEVVPMGPGIVENGAILLDMDLRADLIAPSGQRFATFTGLPTDAEMNVQVSGTATVAIKVVRGPGDDEIFDVPQVLYDMLRGIEGRIFPGLEHLARK